MSIQDIINKRVKEYRLKELEKWNDSIPASLQGYNYDDLIGTNWNNKISAFSKTKVTKYVQDPSPFLLLHGGTGLGKTVMGVEIIKKLLKEEKVNSALYLDTPTLLHELSFSNGNQILNKACAPDILLLDDVGAGTTELTSTRKNGLWALVNKRWSDGKLTILTTNLPITAQGKSNKDEMGLQEWFGTSAWDRVAHNLTEITFKGNSMRRDTERVRRDI